MKETLENKFTHGFELAQFFISQENLSGFFYFMIEQGRELTGKSKGKFVPIVYNSNNNLYNIDIFFLLNSFADWVEEKYELEEWQKSSLRMLISKEKNNEFNRDALFFRYLLVVSNISIAPTKGRVFYSPALYANNNYEDCYFRINAIGLSKTGIDSILTTSKREILLDSFAVKGGLFDMKAYGNNLVNTESKTLKSRGKTIFTLDDYIHFQE